MAHQSLVANYSLTTSSHLSSSSSSPDKSTHDSEQQSPNPLVNVLVVSTVSGKQTDPLLSLHVSQAIKKHVWAGSISILLIFWKPIWCRRTKIFACTSHSTNKLSLTTAKPKVKIKSYNAWNKAF